jgi:hypothetical protein
VAPWVPFTGSFLAKRCQLDFVRGIVAWPVAKGAARFEKISEISLGFGPRPFPPTSRDFLPALRRQIIARRNVLSAAGLHHVGRRSSQPRVGLGAASRQASSRTGPRLFDRNPPPRPAFARSGRVISTPTAARAAADDPPKEPLAAASPAAGRYADKPRPLSIIFAKPWGTGCVRCLIPILLFGGFGYEHL